jgi:hypothetical protein
MKARIGRAVALCAFAAMLVATAHAADASRELHGSADAFAAPGMALAWGVLRGADDERTIVVVRIVTDPAVFTDVAVAGSDPFSDQRRAMLAPASAAAGVDLRTPRAHFAAFPRTEFRFRAPSSTAGDSPSLLVFYLGVPDTTPEFVDEAKLDAYLRGRLAQVRAGKTP